MGECNEVVIIARHAGTGVRVVISADAIGETVLRVRFSYRHHQRLPYIRMDDFRRQWASWGRDALERQDDDLLPVPGWKWETRVFFD